MQNMPCKCIVPNHEQYGPDADLNLRILRACTRPQATAHAMHCVANASASGATSACHGYDPVSGSHGDQTERTVIAVPL